VSSTVPNIPVPGEPLVALKTDPAREPGIITRHHPDGSVTVFWTRARRRWI